MAEDVNTALTPSEVPDEYLERLPREMIVRNLLVIGLAVAACLPGLVMRLAGLHPENIGLTLVFGLSIIGAAFLVAWAAEAAETEVTRGLAVAAIAFIAVLPEYAVDVYFAYTAAEKPEFAQFAVANMTGANRLLVGFGWPLVVFLYAYRTRWLSRELVIDRSHIVEVVFLLLATLYVFTLPLKGHIDLTDTLILGSIFALYVYFVARQPSEEPELLGPALLMASLPRAWKLLSIVVMFLFAAGCIFAAAEPFAEGLVESGTQLGIDEFLLVQWLAPFASEAPEIVIAVLLVLRARAGVAMGALISSKVNQWTLLIGSLPVAYALGGGDGLPGLPLDSRQEEEVFLTAAQSFFAVAILLNLRIGLWESAALLVLFLTQVFITAELVRTIYGFGYLALTAVVLLRKQPEVAWAVGAARQSIFNAPSTGPPG
jgi:cation:H+ antiporter